MRQVWAFALGAALWVSPALCGQGRVLVLAQQSSRPVALRVAAELEAIGFELALADLEQGAEDAASLAVLGRERGAVAVIALGAAEDGALIWGSAANGEGEFFVRCAASKGLADDAIKIVEVLRANLVAFGFGPPRVQATRPSALPAESPKMLPEPLRWTADAGLAGLWGDFHGWPMLHAALGIGLLARDDKAIRLFGYVPLASPSRDSDLGSAKLRAGILGFEVLFFLREPTSRILPSLGLGLGSVLAKAEASANSGAVAKSQNSVAACPKFSFDVVSALSERLALRASLAVAWVLPRLVVRADDEELIAWGQPLIGASLGLLLRLGKKPGPRGGHETTSEAKGPKSQQKGESP